MEKSYNDSPRTSFSRDFDNPDTSRIAELLLVYATHARARRPVRLVQQIERERCIKTGLMSMKWRERLAREVALQISHSGKRFTVK